MDILSVKWIQVITVNGGQRQVSAPPAGDLGDDFTAPTLNQAEKTPPVNFRVMATVHGMRFDHWLHPTY
jgi:hypothetical protein